MRLLYLFCTYTAAFSRFSPIEPIKFSKSFENSTIVADRLPPPPKPYLLVGQMFARPIGFGCTSIVPDRNVGGNPPPPPHEIIERRRRDLRPASNVARHTIGVLVSKGWLQGLATI
jgi:hypothetical protein